MPSTGNVMMYTSCAPHAGSSPGGGRILLPVVIVVVFPVVAMGVSRWCRRQVRDVT